MGIKRASLILPAVKAALLYLGCVILWFASIERLAKIVTPDPVWQGLFKGLTGLGFVGGTAIAISLLVHREMVKLQRLETEVRESEDRFRITADNAPVMIWMSGPDKRCTWFNKPWLDFVGRAMEQELGEGWTANVHPDDLRQCMATHDSAFDARREFQMEYRLRRRDGEYRWLLDNGVPRFNGTEFLGYAGSCLDFSERKRAEKEMAELAQNLAEKNRELEAIVYAASHDLRSPLLNIQGFSRELARVCEEIQATAAAAHDGFVPAAALKEALARDIPRALRFIHAGVARIDALLNGFLRFSRIGRLVLNVQTLDMKALLVGVTEALKFQ